MATHRNAYKLEPSPNLIMAPKYRESDKLTSEQRTEIGHLALAGVPYKTLAEGFDVSIATVSVTRRKVAESIADGQIPKTSNEKFLYAQTVYGSEALSDEGRAYIDESVFRPLAQTPARKYQGPDKPLMELVRNVFGGRPRERDATELEDYGVTLLQQGALEGRAYETQESAKSGLLTAMENASNTHFRIGQREQTVVLENAVDEAFEDLTEREQEVLEMRFGLHGEEKSGLEIVGERYGLSKERIRQIEAQAIRKLRHPSRAQTLYPVAIVLTYAEDLEAIVSDERDAQARKRFQLEIEQEVRTRVLGSLDRESSAYEFIERVFDETVGGQNPAYSISIEEVELTIRARNILRRMGISTLGDLTNKSEGELTIKRNFGETQLQEVRREMASRGIYLKGEVPQGEIQVPYVREVNNIHVAKAEFAIRARLGLEAMGCLTLSDVACFTERELLESPRIGLTSLANIKETLFENGFSLKEEEESD